ncbi:MAG: dephospho-CoA kinase [Aeromonas sp.]
MGVPLIIALTGGIGSGKTTVSNAFAALGVSVVDSDVIARQVVAPGQAALAAIAAHFGHTLLEPSGQLDRRALRERVFSDKAAKAWLNALLHPLIGQEMQRQCAAATSPYCLLVVPLLVENNLLHLASRILLVDVDEATQVRRTCARDGVSPAQAAAIIAAQASRAARLQVADDVLENRDGDSAARQAQIVQLHQRYLALAAAAAAKLA